MKGLAYDPISMHLSKCITVKMILWTLKSYQNIDFKVGFTDISQFAVRHIWTHILIPEKRFHDV